MEASRRDSTEDWLLPERSRPPLLSELVTRIDEALATARASEAAVMTVGAAALDAAEQARRAADLAAQASDAAVRGHFTGGFATGAPGGDDDLGDFTTRAEQVSARLKKIENTPLASVA
jgi:hypothetical protein